MTPRRSLAGVWLASCLLAAAPLVAQTADDVLLADFEGDDYGAWRVEGQAFGVGPAAGTLAGQMPVSGFVGDGLVNSFLGGDGPTGRLVSPPFRITRDYLNFLIGGGGFPDQTCVNLRVDGQVVRTAAGPNRAPGGSEFLNWEHWDVREFRDRDAVLEIVDQASGGWGHINVDQIYLSDVPAAKQPAPASPAPVAAHPHPPRQRDLIVAGKYLLVPIANQGQRGRLAVRVGEQLVHHLDCDFPLAAATVDWWTYLDLSEYQGQTAHVTAEAAEEVCDLLVTSDDLRHQEPPYQERLRPQFHFSQLRGWNNDPNGMFYHDGLYHLFWQCNPAGRNHANMYWGHAVSPDLLHWTELPRALRTYGGDFANRHPSMAVAQAFSGSGHVDLHDTAGWRQGDQPTLVLAFTDTGCGEALAVSHDGGNRWKYFDGNPIIRHRGRDPKLVWYAPGRHWVIAVYDEDPEIGRNIAFYTSPDLKQWELASKLPGYYECPELFALPLDGDPQQTKWVLFAADAEYAVGSFDGRRFTPDHEGKRRVHWGEIYASQCFSNAPEGRVVQIGWARIETPDMPFNQAFTIPTQLTLRSGSDGPRLHAAPIAELDQLREPDPYVAAPRRLAAAESLELPVGETQLCDMVVTLRAQGADKAVLRFGRNRLTYDFNKQQLDEMPLPLQDGRAAFRVLVDRPLFEAFGGPGTCVKTSPRRDMGEPLRTISLTAVGGAADVEHFAVHALRSIWPAPDAAIAP